MSKYAVFVAVVITLTDLYIYMCYNAHTLMNASNFVPRTSIRKKFPAGV